MNLVRRLSIGVRLGIAFGMLLLLLVAVAAFGARNVDHMHDALEDIVSDHVKPLQMMGEISTLMQRDRVLVMDMMLRPTAENIARRDTELRANAERSGKAWAAYRASKLSADEGKRADAFDAARRAYEQEGLRAMRDAVAAGQRAEAERLYVERVSPLSARALEALASVEASLVRESEQATVDARRLERESYLVTASVTIAAIVLGAALSLVIARSITRPLAVAGDAAARIAGGDLAIELDTSGRDEASALAVSLRAMRDQLTGIVHGVRSNAESVASASSQIAQGNQNLSARTEQQAGALQQTASAMTELGATVSQNTENARQADELARTTADVATRGGQVVDQVVATMRDIHQHSSRIADIVSLIDGVAFQTNILALNAAVEAARAGEQGRGFAVVAGEVRSLAQRAAEAAREIKSLIGASVERVDQGAALVDEAGRTMQEVLGSVRRLTTLVGEISSASVEQASGVGQVGQALSSLDQATQHNAALVEESAAAAESLRQQAEHLVQAVGVFRLGTSAR